MNNEQRKIPRAACQFRASALEFASQDKGNPAVRLTARSGQPIEHWYWGRIIHDFAGMRLHKPTIPLDYCHRDEEVIGFLDTFTTESGDLEAAGRLVPYQPGDRASEVKHKAEAGVPYEASINFGGDGIRIQEVQRGEVTEVNGREFEGPGVVVRQWPLRGAAVCPYGADMHTETTFSEGETIPVTFEREDYAMSQEQDQPADNEAVTPDTETTDAAELAAPTSEVPESAEALEQPEVPTAFLTQEEFDRHNEVTEQGLRAECKRFLDVFGPQGGEWYAEGLSFADAQERNTEALKAENKQIKAKLAAVDRGEEEPVDFQAGSEETPDGKASQAVVDNHGDGLAPLIAFNASKMPDPSRN